MTERDRLDAAYDTYKATHAAARDTYAAALAPTTPPPPAKET